MRTGVFLATMILPLVLSCDTNGNISSKDSSPEAKAVIAKEISGNGSLNDSYTGTYKLNITDTHVFFESIPGGNDIKRTCSDYYVQILKDKVIEGKYLINLACYNSIDDKASTIIALHKSIQNAPLLASEIGRYESLNWTDIGDNFIIFGTADNDKQRKRVILGKLKLNFKDAELVLLSSRYAQNSKNAVEIEIGRGEKQNKQ